MEDRYPKRHPSRDGGQEVAIPVRTCIGCRARKPQTEFVRISEVDGSLRVSTERRESGRGAYVCDAEACTKLALTKDRLARALRRRIEANELEELAGILAGRRAG